MNRFVTKIRKLRRRSKNRSSAKPKMDVPVTLCAECVSLRATVDELHERFNNLNSRQNELMEFAESLTQHLQKLVTTAKDTFKPASNITAQIADLVKEVEKDCSGEAEHSQFEDSYSSGVEDTSDTSEELSGSEYSSGRSLTDCEDELSEDFSFSDDSEEELSEGEYCSDRTLSEDDCSASTGGYDSEETEGNFCTDGEREVLSNGSSDFGDSEDNISPEQEEECQMNEQDAMLRDQHWKPELQSFYGRMLKDAHTHCPSSEAFSCSNGYIYQGATNVPSHFTSDMPCNMYNSAEQPYNPMDPNSNMIIVRDCADKPHSYTEYDLWHPTPHQPWDFQNQSLF